MTAKWFTSAGWTSIGLQVQWQYPFNFPSGAHANPTFRRTEVRDLRTVRFSDRRRGTFLGTSREFSHLKKNHSSLTPPYSDIDPIRTHRIREVKKREGATSQEHTFYGRKFSYRDNGRHPLNYPDRHQGSNHRIRVLQDTVSGEKIRYSFPAEPAFA